MKDDEYDLDNVDVVVNNNDNDIGNDHHHNHDDNYTYSIDNNSNFACLWEDGGVCQSCAGCIVRVHITLKIGQLANTFLSRKEGRSIFSYFSYVIFFSYCMITVICCKIHRNVPNKHLLKQVNLFFSRNVLIRT